LSGLQLYHNLGDIEDHQNFNTGSCASSANKRTLHLAIQNFHRLRVLGSTGCRCNPSRGSDPLILPVQGGIPGVVADSPKARPPPLASSHCRRRASRLPAAAARISHCRRRVLRLRPPSPSPRTPPPHLPRRRRVRCLPVVLAIAARTLSPTRAGEPGERWIYIHCQFKVRFSCT
jgi:hypothetical protein